jgi:hypothetical protein
MAQPKSCTDRSGASVRTIDAFVASDHLDPRKQGPCTASDVQINGFGRGALLMTGDNGFACAHTETLRFIPSSQLTILIQKKDRWIEPTRRTELIGVDEKRST